MATATLERLSPPPTSSAARAWSPRRAIAAALTVAAAIAVLQVVQSSGFANTGEQIRKLEGQRVEASAQVHELEAEVAALSSLDRVERNARDRLGMVPARNIVYVQVDVPAPADPLLPRPALGPNTPPAQLPAKPLWQRLFDHLPF